MLSLKYRGYATSARQTCNIEDGTLPATFTSLKLVDYNGTMTATTIPSSVT
ncbi:hypothetical protein SAMD00019534_120790 [Acytostelium subglobosum LB1]|uniref:hypothetical protein n=1 Tax=Acytostelium subglobosum LB1 TaxID=1410327 RepID=UPI00064489D9|nr:hypothetical protein SAMD00019534_120790 [Acytostelium subglobosum LB1]GAM28903.1 hypothetical protein SAMD00019534_120790 [Acytostelium subglobosum LB1]|eukprot:XP_012748088.1 hypothetical protein SAMD00019534_120790 [Acytostelium subglobosum LB1]